MLNSDIIIPLTDLKNLDKGYYLLCFLVKILSRPLKQDLSYYHLISIIIDYSEFICQLYSLILLKYGFQAKKKAPDEDLPQIRCFFSHIPVMLP